MDRWKAIRQWIRNDGEWLLEACLFTCLAKNMNYDLMFFIWSKSESRQGVYSIKLIKINAPFFVVFYFK